MPQIDLKKVTVKIMDGTSPTPNEINVKIGEGNLTWSEKRTIEYKKDRGLLDGVRLGDEEPMDLTLDARFDHYFSSTTDGEDVTPTEALKQQGEAATWVTTGLDVCEPYAVDIHLLYEIACGDVLDDKLVFKEFRYESADFDPKAGTISFKGKCNAKEPVATREDLSP